jgi:hypothetical protein
MKAPHALDPRERELVAVAVALGAPRVNGLSAVEQEIVADLPPVLQTAVRHVVNEIQAGRDPLGEEFCRLRSPRRRRALGATYTPPVIVDAMIRWAGSKGHPARVVDPGAGSGRFLVAAGRAFPHAELIGVELDPVAALLCRGHLAGAGLADRGEVRVEDYRLAALPELPGGQSTLFIGNPPYVRHHLIEPGWKRWLMREGKRAGLRPSSLAGLHVYFYLATAAKARPGDLGCLVTSAEWLDVNYGRMLRELLLNGLGLERICVVEPSAAPFPDAQTTAVIACVELGRQSGSVYVQRVNDCSALKDLSRGRRISRERLQSEDRWSRLTRRSNGRPSGYVELGELCRVHRGQVTGGNGIWIAGEHSRDLPASVLFPTITRARELYSADRELTHADGLKDVIDLPPDLNDLSPDDREAVESFLEYARSRGAHESYIARHRKPWWSVRLREPAPILATYMARRPPAFVLNKAAALHLNIAHGLYPRDAMSDELLRRLVDYLCAHTSLSEGRTYAGGLTKFEPREMERLLVPEPQLLLRGEVV